RTAVRRLKQLVRVEGILIARPLFQRGGSRMILDPSSVPERQAYRLMISAFIPRPIAFVSTVSRSGIDNCAPFSYSMGVSSHPMVRAVRVADNTVFFGEAVRLHVDDRVLTNGIVDARKLHAIGRLGGPQYCRTQDVFEMVRPRVTGPKSARPTDAR